MKGARAPAECPGQRAGQGRVEGALELGVKAGVGALHRESLYPLDSIGGYSDSWPSRGRPTAGLAAATVLCLARQRFPIRLGNCGTTKRLRARKGVTGDSASPEAQKEKQGERLYVEGPTHDVHPPHQHRSKK